MEGDVVGDDLLPAAIYRFTDHLKTGDRYDQYKVGARSSYTVRGYTQVIKGFLAWAAEEELISAKVGAKVEMPRVEKKLIRTFSREQYHILGVACANEMLPWLMHRDRAILAVLLDTGIRASELCTMTVRDVHLEDRTDPHLIVYGKGRKERAVGPLGRESELVLRRYLARHRPEVSAPQVFVSRTFEPLTPSGLDQLLYRLRRWAGPERFPGIRLSAHTFRHTYAVNFLRAGGSIYDLSVLLGHSSVVVTQRYLEDYQQSDARKGKSVLDSWS